MDEKDRKRIPLIISSVVIDVFFFVLFASLQQQQKKDLHPQYRKVIYSIDEERDSANALLILSYKKSIYLFYSLVLSTKLFTTRGLFYILSTVFRLSQCLPIVNKHNFYFVFASSFYFVNQLNTRSVIRLLPYTFGGC